MENELNILTIPQGNEEHFTVELNSKILIISELEEELVKVHSQCAFLGNEVQRLNETIAALQKNNAGLVG